MQTLVKTWITGNDLILIDQIVEKEGWTPLPRTAMAAVMVDEKGVVGFHVLQLRAHAEPLWVREDMRNSPVAMGLVEEMEKFLTDTNTSFICIADTPEVELLCRKFGMHKVTSPVYTR